MVDLSLAVAFLEVSNQGLSVPSFFKSSWGLSTVVKQSFEGVECTVAFFVRTHKILLTEHVLTDSFGLIRVNARNRKKP